MSRGSGPLTVAWVAIALVVGLLLGAATSFTVQDSSSEPHPDAALNATTTSAPPVKPLPELAPTVPPQTLYLAWTSGGLEPGIAPALHEQDLASSLSIVRRENTELVRSADDAGTVVDQTATGFVIPFDAIAFDPSSYTPLLPAATREAFGSLGDDELLLGTTSAKLRGIGLGGTLTFAGGRTYVVAGIVDDESLGGAEGAVTHAGGDGIGLVADRYVLFQSAAERSTIEAAVREAVPADKELRVRAAGETPFLRNGDAVLPQAMIKKEFGEFSYRPTGGNDGDAVEPDPAWVQQNIVTTDVPLVGSVRCHRAIIPALTGALGELEAENLGYLLNPEGFLGCFVPRTTRTSDDLSHHAWGVALDFNYPKNPTGQRSVQDERLVEIFQEWGFTWGGEWLVPDPAHFEYLQPPAGEKTKGG